MMLRGTNDWILLGYSFENNKIMAKVKRLMNTNDPYDYVFDKSNLRVAYAFGNGTGYTYHGANRGVLTI